MEDEKALARGKYEFKKEELQNLKGLLINLAKQISETVKFASDSPTGAYINHKREMTEDVLTGGAPFETQLDELPTKVKELIETVAKYQELNKEVGSLKRQAGK